jgi:hypothetical protein
MEAMTLRSAKVRYATATKSGTTRPKIFPITLRRKTNIK